MKMKQINLCYFSPTGSTKRIIRMVSDRLFKKMGVPVTEIDFTLPQSRKEPHSFGPDELVVFAMPTYAGRLPNKIMPYLENDFIGSNTPCVCIVTFGNRSFDDALAEMVMIAEKKRFIPISACAIVSRHAFSDDIGVGRPDNLDQDHIATFGDKTEKILFDTDDIRVLPSIKVDGHMSDLTYYSPKKEDGSPAKFLKAHPKTHMDLCTRCGICASVCPMGIINPQRPSEIVGTCIKCQACVRSCPHEAKYFDDVDFLSHIRMLKRQASAQKNSKFYYCTTNHF